MRLDIGSLPVAMGLLAAGCTLTPTSGNTVLRMTEQDYAAAERLVSHHLGDKVRNEQPAVNWLDFEDKFWYQRDGDSGPEYVLVDAATGKRQSPYEPEPTVDMPPPVPGMLGSPDGRWSAFARGHNLWVKNHDNGEERQFTTDGEEYFSYGGIPDQFRLGALRSGVDVPLPLANSYWSPDGRYLIVGRLDERDVAEYSFLESAPSNGGPQVRAYNVRVSLLGDSGQRRMETFIFNVETGQRVHPDLPDNFSLSFFRTGNSPIAWAADSKSAYVIVATLGDQIVRLLELDMATGTTRTVLEERTNTSVSLGYGFRAAPNVRILEDSQEVVWSSERDGWGHLYLFGLESGQQRNQITTGNWPVWEIVHVDEAERIVYFIAGGREPDSDPYYRKLYRINLDGSDIRLLTPEEADHEIEPVFSPSGEYFVETYSTVTDAPRSLLRSLQDGGVVAELEKADATDLYATGWRAPERISLKAADGTTDISATVYLPPDFDPERSYPIIDAMYGGPASIVVARTFRQSYAGGYHQASLARLGFIVVSIDGRGTPFRSRAFREAGYGNFADPQLEDHVAAIRQIARRYPSGDLGRVGIYGHSNGGYMSARAMLKHPDFFKVGVASAGPHNFQGLPGTGMPWFGIPRYEGGATTRPDDTAVPENYRVLDNANFASGLQGNLLLICGDMDNTAFPALTLQLANALNKANKSYDLLYLPNRTHSYFVDEPYVMRRIWDYFVEHLLGVAPPINYKMMDYKIPVYQ